ncbi:hypothetical protein E1B28_007942 [Marasmius oreades]|uniref:Uncharacterized protein n=1 Tax=Marasmius oreades TaxID=181124 RepID=A0A9P7S3C0_9AGAR|nr:uncharacterized protein E1B28_007942 [Marasmius oreades]KAG7094342.1 hypothetical protein E1B28_007942 [Marasmius oreades]
MTEPEKQYCSSCRASKPVSAFKQTAGGYTKTCVTCAAKRKVRKRLAGRGSKAATADQQTEHSILDSEEDSTAYFDLSQIPLEDFLSLIRTRQDLSSVVARVDTTLVSVSGTDNNLRSTADRIVECIWATTGYRFTYQSKYKRRRTPSVTFHYHCCQSSRRQHKPKKTQGEEVKQRDKLMMDSFPCDGWIHLTLIDGLHEAYITVKHKVPHVVYRLNNIPGNVRTFVQGNRPLAGEVEKQAAVLENVENVIEVDDLPVPLGTNHMDLPAMSSEVESQLSEPPTTSSGAAAPSNYEEEEISRKELDEIIEKMLERARVFETAAKIIREQALLPGNGVWFKSLARRDIGKDVSDFVAEMKNLKYGHNEKGGL